MTPFAHFPIHRLDPQRRLRLMQLLFAAIAATALCALFQGLSAATQSGLPSVRLTGVAVGAPLPGTPSLGAGGLATDDNDDQARLQEQLAQQQAEQQNEMAEQQFEQGMQEALQAEQQANNP